MWSLGPLVSKGDAGPFPSEVGIETLLYSRLMDYGLYYSSYGDMLPAKCILALL
jgi:hypothetical protein